MDNKLDFLIPGVSAWHVLEILGVGSASGLLPMLAHLSCVSQGAMAAELLDRGLFSSVTVWSWKWSWGWLIRGPGYERPSHYEDSRETEIFQCRSRLEPLLKVHTSPCLFGPKYIQA